MTVDPQITICQPGKRAGPKAVPRVAGYSPIPVITATALQWPVTASIVPNARNDRRTVEERVEAALRADAVSVVLSQPHRGGVDDRLAGSALGRYCLRRWPGDARREMREGRHEAGNRYAQVIDDDRVARGMAPRLYGQAGVGGEQTDQQLRARRELCAQKRADAEWQIRDLHSRAVTVMDRLCWEDRECGPYDEDLVFHALYRFAKHFGIEKRTFHENDA